MKGNHKKGCWKVLKTEEQHITFHVGNGIYNSYLHTISILPSPCTDEKLGASADTSHLYKPVEFNANPRNHTLVLSEFSSCWEKSSILFINNQIKINIINGWVVNVENFVFGWNGSGKVREEVGVRCSLSGFVTS